MTASEVIIVWFRQDLRLADNPALVAAAASGARVVPLYILDDDNAREWALGAASRWWLHQSLISLDKSLQGQLSVLRGAAHKILSRAASETGATAVYWNRCYEPWRIDRDRRIRKTLQAQSVAVRSYNGSLLYEPTTVHKRDGSPYKVFTPYYRNGCLENGAEPRPLVSQPKDLKLLRLPSSDRIDDLQLMPAQRWYDSIAAEWTPGELGAEQRLDRFLAEGIGHYTSGRDRPDQRFVSRLSPHLHFGELSPHQIRQRVMKSATGDDENREHFLRELGWREFSTYLLYHWPEMTRSNLQRKFNRFPWREDPSGLQKWQTGQTGIPIVDAGMRELWQTGFMHNRVRMITASFLVKNLLLHWHHGEDWFWDTLVDADLANNSAGWQWVAGSGADAAPYFRIFNPVTQGRRFDPDGLYVREYVPELRQLPNKHLHAPWEAPATVLQDAGVCLGRDYPQPLVDLKESRVRALAAFRSMTPADPE
ncbi:MAG: deoxyribodipyrimidine photo-lyase [Woeseia sp.]